ncbi:hypothetical protein [Neogemmobacter tilapiae]|uniref:Ig-like domain-containing protein n=1 Tax=Neogemmobacter tilapiae TaxID=875041 RepID=A0A918TNI2_9RHOB|nr:hypothetical protein [Gemmobacter tilapiae]GHC54089.1 hypothetical protein GCM10007315_16120 [Gemmobacter tilapiae]
MNRIVLGFLAVASAALGAASAASAADESQMMTICNTYAAHHLHVSPSDIVSLTYEGTRSDGTHAVNGSASNGQTFQCSFNPAGRHVVHWTHTAPTSCPVDVSEADRYLYPACE